MSGLAENVVASRALAAGRLGAFYLAALAEAADASRGTTAAHPERSTSDRRRRDETAAPRESLSTETTWMEREILYEYRQIRDAVRADPLKRTSNEEFEAAVRQLLDFARQRPDFVTAEIRKQPDAAAPGTR
jgi:hypothetical protein